MKKIFDEYKLLNIRKELKYMNEIYDSLSPMTYIAVAKRKLKSINESIWLIEESIRMKEKNLTNSSLKWQDLYTS